MNVELVAALLTALSIILAATFWILKSQFVSKEQYQLDQEKLQAALESIHSSMEKSHGERSGIISGMEKLEKNSNIITSSIHDIALEVARLGVHVSNLIK